MAVGFTADIRVDVAIVVTTVSVGLMCKFALMGKGCSINLTLNLSFTGSLALFFFSAFLGTGVFCGKELLQANR